MKFHFLSQLSCGQMFLSYSYLEQGHAYKLTDKGYVQVRPLVMDCLKRRHAYKISDTCACSNSRELADDNDGNDGKRAGTLSVGQELGKGDLRPDR